MQNQHLQENEPHDPGRTQESRPAPLQRFLAVWTYLYEKSNPAGVLFAALFLSSLLFYMQMKIEVYGVLLFFVTLLLLCLFYSLFSQKWIPFGIHIALSLLQFADVLHNSYFNGYLSLNMLGSARYLGDVTDILGELIRPRLFLLFLWIPPAAFAVYKANHTKTALRFRDMFRCLGLPSVRERFVSCLNEAVSRIRAGEGGSRSCLGEDSSRPCSDGLSSRGVSFWKTARERFEQSGWRGRIACRLLGIAVFVLFLFNPAQIPLLQSVGNLEFLSFHLRDAASVCFGIKEETYLAEAEEAYQSDGADPLYGMAQGRNLIVIQAEGLQNFVIGRKYNGREITPNLNRLTETDSLYFDRYYMQIGAGNTSDAEFATNNSLYGSNQSYTYEIYKDNAFRGLPWLLMEKGYQTAALHAYDGNFWSRNAAYPTQGFRFFVSASGYRAKGPKTEWGVNDEDFFNQSAAYLEQLPQPFYSFLITLSNHTPFHMPDALQEHANITLQKKHRGTRFGDYLTGVSYTDHAIGQFIEQLAEAGLYENSVIVVYGDHFGLAIEDDRNAELMEEFLGKPYQFDSMANIPLIIHIPGAEPGVLPQRISTAGGQLDFLPTISYLMGFEKLDTLYLGNNLLDTENGLVIQDRYAPPGSFLTNDVAYFGLGDGVFETGKAWDIHTGEKVFRSSELKAEWQRALGLLNLSAQYLEEDTIRKLYYADGREDRVETRSPTSPKMLRKMIENPDWKRVVTDPGTDKAPETGEQDGSEAGENEEGDPDGNTDGSLAPDDSGSGDGNADGSNSPGDGAGDGEDADGGSGTEGNAVSGSAVNTEPGNTGHGSDKNQGASPDEHKGSSSGENTGAGADPGPSGGVDPGAALPQEND